MKQSIPDIGNQAPDFTVKTSGNDDFTFSSILNAGHNIMLVFYRGHW